MNSFAYDKLRQAFGARECPTELLRSGLSSVDKLDADDFIAGINEGRNIVEFFHSAIPYFTFLSDGAMFYYFTDFLKIIGDDRSELITVLLSMGTDGGRRMLSKLTDRERTAIMDLLQTLHAEEEHDVMRKLLDKFGKLVTEPNKTQIQPVGGSS